MEESSPLSTNVERGIGGEAEVTFPRCCVPYPVADFSR